MGYPPPARTFLTGRPSQELPPRSGKEQQGCSRAPAYKDLVAPVDSRLRGAPLVLCEHGHQSAGGGLDPIRRAGTEIADLPHRAAQLVDPCTGQRLLAETHLLRPQRHPYPLADAELLLLVN